MKKFMFLAMMSAFMFACSDKDDPASANENPEGNVTFEIAAVNNMQDGVNSRTPLYSQEATQLVFSFTLLLIMAVIMYFQKHLLFQDGATALLSNVIQWPALIICLQAIINSLP